MRQRTAHFAHIEIYYISYLKKILAILIIINITNQKIYMVTLASLTHQQSPPGLSSFLVLDGIPTNPHLPLGGG